MYQLAGEWRERMIEDASFTTGIPIIPNCATTATPTTAQIAITPRSLHAKESVSPR